MRLLRHRRETLSKISLGTQRERWARSRKAQMEEATDARQIVQGAWTSEAGAKESHVMKLYFLSNLKCALR